MLVDSLRLRPTIFGIHSRRAAPPNMTSGIEKADTTGPRCKHCANAAAAIVHHGDALCLACYEANVPPWDRNQPEGSTPGLGRPPIQTGIPAGPKPRWAVFWPRIDGWATAEAAAQHGFWAAAFCAGATAVAVALGAIGIDLLGHGHFGAGALLDATLFIVIAWGIRRGLRVAAVAGLALYAIERVASFAETGRAGGPMVILITLFFVHGIRGTFAAHRYLQDARASQHAP